MFELIHGCRRPTWRERLRRALDPERCLMLTVAQRFVRACAWFVLGAFALMALVVAAHFALPVAPVNLLDPQIEHRARDYTIYRLRFEWRGVEKSCRFTVYHDRQTWRLECDPR
jgi:hypothetical protein